MRRVFPFASILTLAVSVFPLAGCRPGEEAGQAPPAETAPPAMNDQDALGELATEFTAAWDAGKAERLADLWTADGDYVNPQGETFRGREAIHAAYVLAFEGPYKDTRLTVATTSIRFLQPDVALVDGSYQITGIKDREGKNVASVQGLYTYVAVKKDGQWLIVSHRPMIPAKPAATS